MVASKTSMELNGPRGVLDHAPTGVIRASAHEPH